MCDLRLIDLTPRILKPVRRHSTSRLELLYDFLSGLLEQSIQFALLVDQFLSFNDLCLLLIQVEAYRGGLVCLNSAARFDKWNRAAVR